MRHVRMISKHTVPALGNDEDEIFIIGPLRVVSYLRLLGLGAKKSPGFPAEGDPEDIY